MAQDSVEIIEIDLEKENSYARMDQQVNHKDVPAFWRQRVKFQQEDPYAGLDPSVNWRQRVKCQICWETVSVTYLQDHIQRLHTNRIKEKCPFCPLESLDLRKHIHRKHRDFKEMTGPCCFCKKTFNSTASLEIHYKTVHNITEFQIKNYPYYKGPRVAVQSSEPDYRNFEYVMSKDPKFCEPYTDFVPIRIAKKSMPALIPMENDKNVTVINLGSPTDDKAAPKRPSIEIIELDCESIPRKKAKRSKDENQLVIDTEASFESNTEDVPNEHPLNDDSDEDIDETEFNDLTDYFL